MAESWTWELWIPDAASRGIAFALGVAEPADALWVHAAPSLLRVEVRDGGGRTLAAGDGLRRNADSPMTRLEVRDGKVARSDEWPVDSDLGSLVILPGGEVGRLRAWWNAPDHSAWRWSLEFENHR
jgi:hypothetical protein